MGARAPETKQKGREGYEGVRVNYLIGQYVWADTEGRGRLYGEFVANYAEFRITAQNSNCDEMIYVLSNGYSYYESDLKLRDPSLPRRKRHRLTRKKRCKHYETLKSRFESAKVISGENRLRRARNLIEERKSWGGLLHFRYL